MPFPEATPSNLIRIGNSWNLCLVGGKSIAPDNLKVIQAELLRITGYQIYTVWHAHDPFVREKGKRGLAYKTIMAHAAVNGAAEAQTFLDWYNGLIDFSQLSGLMQNLAIIVFVAEVGRGYGGQAIKGLIDFLERVAAGQANWGELKDYYPPALTAREDEDWTE